MEQVRKGAELKGEELWSEVVVVVDLDEIEGWPKWEAEEELRFPDFGPPHIPLPLPRCTE